MAPFIEVLLNEDTYSTTLINTLHIREVRRMTNAPASHTALDLKGKTVFTQESYDSVKAKIAACFSGANHATQPTPL